MTEDVSFIVDNARQLGKNLSRRATIDDDDDDVTCDAEPSERKMQTWRVSIPPAELFHGALNSLFGGNCAGAGLQTSLTVAAAVLLDWRSTGSLQQTL